MTRSLPTLSRPAVALVLALTVVLAACGSAGLDVAGQGSAGQAEAGEPGVRVVASNVAQGLLAEEPAPTLIDVRTPAEFAESHLAGASLVDFNAADFRERIATYPRDASYVIYCRSGNRSEGARRVMTDLGFTDVADIEGGILAWTQAGLPTTP